MTSPNTEFKYTPYRTQNDEFAFTDSFLAQLFRRAVFDETIKNIFYDRPIENTQDFQRFFKDKKNEMYILSHEDQDAGFLWLNTFRQRTAIVSYFIFKDYWGAKALEIVQWTTNQILTKKKESGDFTTDVLLSLTPANNKWAILFQKKVGMTVVGKIPQSIVLDRETVDDGVLAYITRVETLGRQGIKSKILSILQ